MVSIQIGTTDNDKLSLNKHYNLSEPISVRIKGTTTIEKPVFILNTNNAYINANYVYCPTWGRYYFISAPPTVSEGGTMELHCEEDYLMSFQSGLLELDCLIARNEFDYEPNIVDNEIVVKSKRQIVGEEFGTSVTTDDTTYILGVI